MNCRAVVAAVVLLLSTAGTPAIAQRDVQRARPGAAQERAQPTPSIDQQAKLRFLEDLVARATPEQRRGGADGLGAWLASHSATLERADVRLTPRKPDSELLEAYLRAEEVAAWSGNPALGEGFVRDPAKLVVEFDPPESTGELYLADFTLYVTEEPAVFQLSDWTGWCLVNFKREDTLPLDPGDNQHLLAVIQVNSDYKCTLILEETTGVQWGFLAWEATRMD